MFKHFLPSINFKEPNVRKSSFRMFDKDQAKYANKLFGRFFFYFKIVSLYCPDLL